jgi:flavorubredoxin
VASETFLLRGVHPMVGAPLSIYASSLVIRGDQPVIVDTGMRADRDLWLTDLTALVDPVEVRWVFLSHDGAGHVGNLPAVLDLCPHATLVSSWAASTRSRGAIDLPADRLRWVADDDVLDIGDRVLRVLRPPAYDSPVSRALFDAATRALWTSDTFATPMPPHTVERVDELSPRVWAEGMALLHHHALSPWLSTIDRAAYAAQVGRLRALEPTVVVSAHSPVITEVSLDAAFDHLAALPDVTPPPHPAHPGPHSPLLRSPA